MNNNEESVVHPDMEASYEGNFEVEDVANWLPYLDAHGYVVIKNVATKEEIDKGLNLLWDYLESFPDGTVDRNDPTTWNMKAGWFPNVHNGLGNGYGFGQCAFAWHSRLLPKVEQTFKTIWGEDKQLITSFDGGNVFRSIIMRHLNHDL